jgi:hypothetical protein
MANFPTISANFCSNQNDSPPKSKFSVHDRGGGGGNAKYRIVCWGDVRWVLVTQDRYGGREGPIWISENGRWGNGHQEPG